MRKNGESVRFRGLAHPREPVLENEIWPDIPDFDLFLEALGKIDKAQSDPKGNPGGSAAKGFGVFGKAEFGDFIAGL